MNPNPSITLTFKLPPDYLVPNDGDCETRINIQVINASRPINVMNWSQPTIADGQWNFSFQHKYVDVSVKYQVNIQLTHNRNPLLLDLDYFVTVAKAPHRQIIHLSPIGQLYVEAQPPKTIEREQAVSISAHEYNEPDAELVRIQCDEETASAFYLNYDPAQAVPGKRYTLKGMENRYGQTISVSPDIAVLAPFGFKD
ncbi:MULTISPECIES: hypothetical protein [unclassified Pseudomonas]|uniref:hypothetical protein n=1 Tax=unclassified Pseudomonas TaxID=196821 RepID=UPI002AC9DB41|nr:MULTISPECIES: hypothetical protein [unclassified Pseudomonas]MEB0047726.1 hypothetical protein [Pseudomonas sp. Dout3]MEB0094588.1 hypothetical protein [Pseudomonas sp. DC1.2]WPX60040.1 hypothetical protein RHM68_05185 [Pseudomonas sp. DC1.2]